MPLAFCVQKACTSMNTLAAPHYHVSPGMFFVSVVQFETNAAEP